MREIKGNIKGIRDSVIAELQKLYDMQSPQLVSQELAVKLADITEYINREISVYITRSGQIIEIAVGDNTTVELPSFSGIRAYQERRQDARFHRELYKGRNPL